MSTTEEWIARTLEGIEASLDGIREDQGEHLKQLKRIADALERLASVAETIAADRGHL